MEFTQALHQLVREVLAAQLHIRQDDGAELRFNFESLHGLGSYDVARIEWRRQFPPGAYPHELQIPAPFRSREIGLGQLHPVGQSAPEDGVIVPVFEGHKTFPAFGQSDFVHGLGVALRIEADELVLAVLVGILLAFVLDCEIGGTAAELDGLPEFANSQCHVGGDGIVDWRDGRFVGGGIWDDRQLVVADYPDLVRHGVVGAGLFLDGFELAHGLEL